MHYIHHEGNYACTHANHANYATFPYEYENHSMHTRSIQPYILCSRLHAQTRLLHANEKETPRLGHFPSKYKDNKAMHSRLNTTSSPCNARPKHLHVKTKWTKQNYIPPIPIPSS